MRITTLLFLMTVLFSGNAIGGGRNRRRETDHQIDFVASNHEESEKQYTNQRAIQIEGGAEVAKRVIEKHGFRFLGEIFQDYYHIMQPEVAERSTKPSIEYNEKLAAQPEVRWLKQQTAKIRQKRPNDDEVEGHSASTSWTGNDALKIIILPGILLLRLHYRINM